MKTIKQLMTALLLLVSLEGFGTAPTITGFSPASGPIGTVVTITGTNLSSPTAFSIGGVSAIVVSNTATKIVGLVMPGAVTGSVSVTASGGTATGSSSYTVTGTLYPTNQMGPKLVGSGSVSGWGVGGIDSAFQGWSVAISGDGKTAMVGGPADSLNVGAVWVYTRYNNGTWPQQGQKLVGTGEVGSGSRQGSSVALSGDGNTAVVGGLDDDNGTGAVWIFTRSGTTWTQQGAKLVASGSNGTSLQGCSVAVSADGNTVLVGGYGNGGAWVYTRSGTTWTQQGGKLLGTGAVNPGFGIYQGYAVALSADGNTAMVGSPYDNNNIGAAWIFSRSGSTWTQQGSKLVGTGAVGSYVCQGWSVALSADGNTALVGGPYDNSTGAVWAYTRTGTTWAQQGAKLTAGSGEGLGSSVSLSADGNTAVIGAFYDNSGVGALWNFTRSGTTWTEQGARLIGSGAAGHAAEGGAISLSADGNTVITGGQSDSSGVGAAWIFVDSVFAVAGPDQIICKSADTVTMAAHGTGTWTQGSWLPYFSGPAPIIANPSSPTTTISGFTVAGIYEFAWTGSGFSDTMTVTVDSLCGGSGGCHLTDSIGYVYNGSTEYTFTAHTSGATSPAYVWKANGQTPIIGQYSANTALLTLAPGLNVISVTITDSATGCINVDSITLHAPNCGLLGIVNEIAAGSGAALSVDNIGGTPPFSYHWSNGSTQAIDTVYSNGAYFVTVTDSAGCQAYPGDTVTGLSNCHLSASITEYSGNPTVIDTFSAHVTGETGWVSFSWTGTTATTAVIAETPQAVCLTVRDSIGCTVTVCDTPLAQLSAGPDQAYCLFSTGNYIISLNGSGAGDWEAMPGNPSVVSIWDTTAPVTGASNAFNPGVYGFIRTNGIMSDTCYVTIYPLRNVTTPTATINLNGSVLAKATGSGSWQAIATNPSVANIFHPLSDTTTISGFSSAGSYYFIWTSNHGCQDTMYVQVLSSASSAGPDQTVCAGFPVTMAASGTGSWSALPGNPHTTTIVTPSSPTTTVTGFTVPGIYGFEWGTTPGDTMYVTVDSLLFPTVSLSVSAPTICSGQPDTFYATPSHAGTSSYYHWFVNGNPNTAGYNLSAVYISSSLTSSDTISVALITFNATCTGLDSTVSNSIYVTVNNCSSLVDTVWPGDADNNKLVDNRDLLTIGLGYDSIGPVRTVQGNVWQADLATDWAHDFTIYMPTVNFVHADCNGDGTINADDTVAIGLNWGDTHAKTNNLPGPWRSGIPALSLSFSQDTASNNDTLTVGIILGSNAIPVSNIYGLAFTFNYDPLVIDSNYSIFAFNSSWLGTAANSININRNSTAAGQVKASITGIDHIARSGNGQIATFTAVITTGNINGKDWMYYHNLNYISDITAIDQYGNPVPLNAGIDSDYVGYFISGIKPLSAPTIVNVYPNPAATQVRISADVHMTEIRIIDIVGEIIQTININGKKSEAIDISQLAAGVYTVRVSAAGGSATAKLIVSR